MMKNLPFFPTLFFDNLVSKQMKCSQKKKKTPLKNREILYLRKKCMLGGKIEEQIDIWEGYYLFNV